MDCSTPGFPVHHQILKLVQAHVHQGGDAIQPSHPLLGTEDQNNRVVPFSSCLQSFPASGSFPMSQFFISGGQSIGASASASVLSMNIQDWFPLGLTGLISFKSLLQYHSSNVFTTFCHFSGDFTIPSFQNFLFEQRTVPGAFYSLPRN